ncbi:major facilitator transporter [Pandoraea eparura]|jgi:sugar phosphate permease|uniref:Major facilitator transporter n=1 Tax=Pandoraea eparura TaxID=2508291 RepID=A0A5E4UUI9_9BURK|nr:MFS transporter [Pandoraea eparura]VVE03617.1 major facilitator transporter [Pandoraea eparura]
MQADTHLVGRAPASGADAIYRKVTWRIIPLLFLCYIAAYLDRINIGFAQAAIRTDLAFSGTAFSFGASVFFIGYLLFEVPSNMYLERVGTRKTLARIMVLWGLISAATMFVRTPEQFYVLRFLLGSAEAGFFPGVVLYLTYWFPPQRRAKIVALFMLPVAFAGFFGAPLSGLIMQTLDGANGWHGWQWMFLLEAIPSVVLGAVVLKYLTDRPRDAHRWLTPSEIAQIEGDLAHSNVPAASHDHGVWRTLLTDWRIYVLILGYSALNASVIGIGIWMPQILREASHNTSSVFVGMLTAIPYAAGGVGMLLFGIGSDFLAERRRFCAGLLALTGLGFVLAGLTAHNLPMLLVALSLVLVGNLSGYPVFWALTSQHFRISTAAVGVALVSSIGQLGSFASPMIINASKTLTGSVAGGLDAIASLLFVAAIAIFFSFQRSGGSEGAAHQ